MRHEEDAVPGLELQVDAADDLEAARTEVMEALALTAADVIWIPGADAPAG
jgi:hypothetical protein